MVTKRNKALEKKLQKKLKKGFELHKKELCLIKDEEKLAVWNSTIRKTHRLNMEYKYKQATHSMIHDGKKAQVSSMVQALKFLGILKA